MENTTKVEYRKLSVLTVVTKLSFRSQPTSLCVAGLSFCSTSNAATTKLTTVNNETAPLGVLTKCEMWNAECRKSATCILRNTDVETSCGMTYKMRNGMSNTSTVNVALFMGA